MNRALTRTFAIPKRFTGDDLAIIDQLKVVSMEDRGSEFVVVLHDGERVMLKPPHGALDVESHQALRKLVFGASGGRLAYSTFTPTGRENNWLP